MKDWLLTKLNSKISDNLILLEFGLYNGVPGMISVNIDEFLVVLFGGNLPTVGNYENLVAGDTDGVKGYKKYFEQWHIEGLI